MFPAAASISATKRPTAEKPAPQRAALNGLCSRMIVGRPFATRIAGHVARSLWPVARSIVFQNCSASGGETGQGIPAGGFELSAEGAFGSLLLHCLDGQGAEHGQIWLWLRKISNSIAQEDGRLRGAAGRLGLGGWVLGDGVRVMGVAVVATMVFGPGKGRRYREEEQGSEENLLHAKNVAPVLRCKRVNSQAGSAGLHQERKQGGSKFTVPSSKFSVRSSQFIARGLRLSFCPFLQIP